MKTAQQAEDIERLKTECDEMASLKVRNRVSWENYSHC